MMLDLQQPRPMPHAIPLPSVDPYLSWNGIQQSTTTPNKLPPLKVTPANPSPSPTEKIIYRPATSALYTPPEMNAPLPISHPVGGYEGAPNSLAGWHPAVSQYSQVPPATAYAVAPPDYPLSLAHDSQPTGSRVIPASNATTCTLVSQLEGAASPVDSANSHDLHIPATVRCPQMSLAQLAAEITCLFWFENGNVLKGIEAMPTPPSTPVNYVPDAKPTLGFRKWVANLLSTTQVKPNVVLLALNFIYRLKGANPSVKGKSGSEYRLLTVALMLGNKFLDDNTYTNKTWADVSGISAQEVHIMEVEFLSNMRYSLFVSEAEWKLWHVSLGKFGTYIAQSIQFWDNSSRPARLQPATGMAVPPSLPSPPASSSASPQVLTLYSPNNSSRITTPLVHSRAVSSVPSPVRLPYEPELRVAASRKRSYDEESVEPAAKRQASAAHYQLPHVQQMAPFAVGSSASASGIPRTAPSMVAPLASLAVGLPPVPVAISHLPAPGYRSMSLAYPQLPMSASQSTAIPPIQTNILPQPNPLRLESNRILSPFAVDSATSSPVSATGPVYGTPQTRLSPSYYLAQRSSPYKPVRRPHTLLAPPPTMALHNPARKISMDQMQYHSLGRPMNERQHGHIPYQQLQQQHWSPLPSIQLGASQYRI